MWVLPRTVLAVSVLSGCRPEAPTRDSAEVALGGPATSLVVLVLDGLRVEESFGEGSSSINGAPTDSFLPQLRERYLDQGLRATAAANIGVTITTEAHVELLTGRRQSLATFERGTTETYRSDVPTLFELVRKERGLSRSQTALYTNSVVVEDTTWSVHPEHRGRYAPTYVHDASSAFPGGLQADMDRDLMVRVQDHMKAHDTHMMLVNLHGIDMAGHMGEGTAYLDMVEQVDGPLVDFLSFIEESDTYGDRTLVAMVADHGRHRWGEDDDWRNHGDQCMGCRQLPLFLWAPGDIHSGELDAVVTLADLSQTFAAWLDVDLAHGHGRVVESIFQGPTPGGSVVGDGAVAASGGTVVMQRWTAAGEPRAEIVVADRDGRVLSDPDAFTSEAPQMVASETLTAICWRSLPVVEISQTLGDWSWEPRCAVRTPQRDWTQIGFPDVVVSASWAPAMTIDGQGSLWVVSDDNPNGYTGSADVRPLLARWDVERGWMAERNASEERSLPTSPAAVALDFDAGERAELLVGVAFSTDHSRGRDTRSIGIDRVTINDLGKQTWSEVLRLEPSDSIERRERPSLTRRGSAVGLAHLAYDSNGQVQVQVSVSEDDGDTWSEPRVLDDSGRVLGHIGPVWSADGRLSWARLDGQVELCSLSAALTSSSEPICTPLEAQIIDSLSVDGSGWWVSLRTEEGRLEMRWIGP